jgi:hypothetical protein
LFARERVCARGVCACDGARAIVTRWDKMSATLTRDVAKRATSAKTKSAKVMMDVKRA